MRGIFAAAAFLQLVQWTTLLAQDRPKPSLVPKQAYQELGEGRAQVFAKYGYGTGVQSKGCSFGGPIQSFNGVFFRFSDSNGTSSKDLLRGARACFLTGLGFRPPGSSLYVVSSAQGSSQVSRVSIDGSFSPFASLSASGSGAEFPVDELEFDASGNAYLLKAGDYNHVFSIAKDTFDAGGSISVGTASYTLPGASVESRPMALVSTGAANSIWVVFQASVNSPLLVREISFPGNNSTIKPVHPKSGGWGPMTDNISGYFRDGFLFIFRSDVLYRMKASESSMAEAVGALDQLSGVTTHDLTYIP